VIAPSVAVRVRGGRLGRGNRGRGCTMVRLRWRLGGVWVALAGVMAVEGARWCALDGGPTTTREQCDALRTFFDDFGSFSGDFGPKAITVLLGRVVIGESGEVAGAVRLWGREGEKGKGPIACWQSAPASIVRSHCVYRAHTASTRRAHITHAHRTLTTMETPPTRRRRLRRSGRSRHRRPPAWSVGGPLTSSGSSGTPPARSGPYAP